MDAISLPRSRIIGRGTVDLQREVAFAGFRGQAAGVLRAFLRFCNESGWVESNPAQTLKQTKVTHRPTMPFDVEEIARIFDAAERVAHKGRFGKQIRAMVLLLQVLGTADSGCGMSGTVPPSRRQTVPLYTEDSDARVLPAAAGGRRGALERPEWTRGSLLLGSEKHAGERRQELGPRLRRGLRGGQAADQEGSSTGSATRSRSHSSRRAFLSSTCPNFWGTVRSR